MVSPDTGLPVPFDLRRELHESRERWIESGAFAVDLLCRSIDREDLAEVDLLDVGCGTKLVKVLLDDSLPIRRYAGIDVSAEVIDWLQANVSDPRFEFHRLDAHNDMYNPNGSPLEDFDLLPVGERRFDLISLFSVFTHLAPHDFVAMLRLLRRHVEPDGRLLFSLFLIDAEHPSPYEVIIRERLNSDDPEIRARTMTAIEESLRQAAAAGRDSRFVDEIPEKPLARARYARDYALELVDGTGWKVDAIHPPDPRDYIQHYMVCHPI